MIPPCILKDNLFRNVKMIYVLIELDNNNGEQDFGFKNVHENYILIITEFFIHASSKHVYNFPLLMQ